MTFAKHPFHMTRAELDALSPADRRVANAMIDRRIWGDEFADRYLNGDYAKVGSKQATEWGQ